MSRPPSRIGWIGTGRMGHAMVERLLRAGRDVHVWNRTRSKAEDLADLGAVLVGSVAELADRDVVFTMVAADADLIEVLLGNGGLLGRRTRPPSSSIRARCRRRRRSGCVLRRPSVARCCWSAR